MFERSASWFGGLLRSIEGSKTEDLTYFEDLKFENSVGEAPSLGTKAIVPDECYIELKIESLRIEKARVFATQFHGIVYSFVTINRDFEEPSQMAALTKPTALTDLDAKATGKVITLSRKMLGPIAWRGGDIGLELGLFSVKSGDLISPFVNFLTKISETAGVSFIGAAKPFVALLSEGMGLLAGQSTDTKLEVGLDTSMRLAKPMLCAIIAMPRGTFGASDLSIDPFDRKLLANGKPIRAGYCVFSITATDRKEDFGAIPELRDSYAALRKAVSAADPKIAREALTAFRRTVLMSQDLIPSDAASLVAKAEAKVAIALAPAEPRFAGPAAAPEREEDMPLDLQDIPLY